MNDRLQKLQRDLGATQEAYSKAGADVRRLGAAKAKIAAAPGNPIVIPGEGRMRTRTFGGSPGVVQAGQEVQRQLDAAIARRDATAPQFRGLEAQFKDFSATARANAMLRGAGVTPTVPPAATGTTARTLEAPVRGDAFRNVTNSASLPSATAAAVPKPGDLNTYTFGGVTRSLDAAHAAHAQPTAQPAVIRSLDPVAAIPSNAPAVQAATQRTLQGQRDATRTTRADATELLNPMSASGEVMRRLENVGISSQFRGSPAARADMRQALMGQLGAQNDASSAGQEAANRALLQGADNEARAGEGFAERRLDADQFNVTASQATDELAQRGRAPSQIGIVRGLDGASSIVRNDGSVSTLRDETGKPIQTPEPVVEGGITPRALFDARSDEIAAIQKNEAMTAEERRSAIDAINARPEYAALAPSDGQRQVPAGLTKVGTKNGKAVYRDAAGNLHIDD